MRQAPQVDLHRIERVAIVKLSSIGDVVHALPVSAALKRSFAHLQITWIVEERCAEMVTGNPYLHEVLTIPGKAWRHGAWHPRTWQEVQRIVGVLRSRHFQLTIDLQGLLKSAVVAWLTGAPVRIGYHWQREGAWLFNRVVPKEPSSKHAVQEYLDVARYLGAETEPVEFPLFIPREAEEQGLPSSQRSWNRCARRLYLHQSVCQPEVQKVADRAVGRPYHRNRPSLSFACGAGGEQGRPPAGGGHSFPNLRILCRYGGQDKPERARCHLAQEYGASLRRHRLRAYLCRTG
jgi:hypothetical protein